MKVLVSGATGFIGKRVVQVLLEKGHEVVILSRSPEKAVAELAKPVKAYAWRPNDELPPKAALEGVEGVIHLAGEGIAERRWSDSQKKRILDSRVLGTRHLVQAIGKPGSTVKTFVSASAIGFYGDRPGETLTEASTPGTGFLAEVCRAWEAEAHQVPPSIRAVQLRVGIVLGDDGGALKKLLPLFRLGVGGSVGKGDQQMSWIHVDDVAALFVYALETASVSGPLNATAPAPVSNKEFSKALGAALHRPAFMPAPAFGLKLAMGEMAALVLDGAKVLPKKTKEAGFRFHYPTLEGALGEICKKKSSSH